ncbi:MAG: hypothetical protein U1G07_10630 [Verrucomicrobiota bacterium]
MRALPAAYPLDDFYARARLPLPEIEMIEPAEMPEPYRRLLVHNNDMTPTLSAYHARVIHLRVLGRQYRDDYYFREVVLVTDETELPVEFGAIRINLALSDAAATFSTSGCRWVTCCGCVRSRTPVDPKRYRGQGG